MSASPADKAKQAVLACEKEITGIKSQIRSLAGESDEDLNSLTIAWLKVGGWMLLNFYTVRRFSSFEEQSLQSNILVMLHLMKLFLVVVVASYRSLKPHPVDRGASGICGTEMEASAFFADRGSYVGQDI